MYTVDDQDEVVPLTGFPLPDIGAPLPRLDSDEHEATITYFVQGSRDARATVTFSGLCALLSGPPNDEALHGHPLASRGLESYGVFEIKQSSWVRALERMNRVHPRHLPEHFDMLRHVVITFHDSTFECVAESATVTQEQT
ncbi:MAG: hypothetical protein AAFQ43_05075 [Bacteroidota bacterium]